MRHWHPQQSDLPSPRPDSAPGHLMRSTAPHWLRLRRCSCGRAPSSCVSFPPGIGAPAVTRMISPAPGLCSPPFTRFSLRTYLPKHASLTAPRLLESLSATYAAEQNPLKAHPAVEV